MKNHLLIAVVVALFVSCQLKNTNESETESDPGYQQGVAKEVLQATNYTYILTVNDGKEIWIAVPKMNAKVGEKYYFIQNMEMENFQSKELNRSFDNILFVQEITTSPGDLTGKLHDTKDYKSEVKIEKQNIKIDPIIGIVSIADIFLNKSKYKGTRLAVKGVVTKYNPEIMGKNWIHIQDGTENNGNFDLVITTMVKTEPGDTLVLEGNLALDKDFGFGYKYDVLLEDAVKKQ